MIEIIFAIVLLGFIAGIALILKTGFNEEIRGLESIDERLKRVEEKLKGEHPAQ